MKTPFEFTAVQLERFKIQRVYQDLENPCVTNGLRIFPQRKNAKNPILGNEIRTPDKNKRLQTSNECNSERNIQNAVHLGQGAAFMLFTYII